MTTNLTQVRDLMALATGDEKHNQSAHSTLDILWVLYDRVLRYDPANPRDLARDRFLLSKGHGPVAFYAILAAKGFFPVADLRDFESWHGRLGSHPDRNQVPGVEVSTGSLGHGLPMAVGVALALRAQPNPAHVFVLVGDGECNEGSIWESLLLAGNQHLSHLTCIVVNNHSSTADLGDLATRFSAFGWSATTIDGRNHQQIYTALTTHHPDQPAAIIAETEPKS